MFNQLISVTSNVNMDDCFKELKELANKKILVGIPDSTEHDSKGKGDHITNAQLMYIHTNGVRNRDMKEEMQHNLDNGTPYTKAHEMYIHEHGSPMYAIPPRPVLEPAINNSKDKISDKLKKVLQLATEGGDYKRQLELTGLYAEGVCKNWFTNPSNGWLANAEITIKAKGSENPLIDQGGLRKAITYVVKE